MKNSILSVMHETAKGLHEAGVMTDLTMREFDAMCLPKVEEFTPFQITELRNKFRASPTRICYVSGCHSLHDQAVGARQKAATGFISKVIESGSQKRVRSAGVIRQKKPGFKRFGVQYA